MISLANPRTTLSYRRRRFQRICVADPTRHQAKPTLSSCPVANFWTASMRSNLSQFRPAVLPPIACGRHAAEPAREASTLLATMSVIQSCELPDDALLGKYRDAGAYTDCYVTLVGRPVTHSEYVEFFYTTVVFKVERLLLSWFVSRSSTDQQAQKLAYGKLHKFSAWTVEARSQNQVLLSDFSGRTRSWFMSVPVATNARASTRLYFGSAVLHVPSRRYEVARMSFGFRALLGFHKLYSRILLRAAASRLASSRKDGRTDRE